MKHHLQRHMARFHMGMLPGVATENVIHGAQPWPAEQNMHSLSTPTQLPEQK